MINRKSVFKNSNKLSLSYIPAMIPHRESKLKHLKKYFYDVLKDKTSYEHAFIVGDSGTGKTLVSRHLEKYVKDEGKGKIISIYVNSRLERSPGNIIRKMINSIYANAVLKGYSFDEIYTGFLKNLADNNEKALLILDDADHLFKRYKNFIYKLSRAEEVFPEFINRLSILFIVHTENILTELDPWTSAGLHKNIVYFEDYTYRKLLDILMFRSGEAFHEDTISNETIETAVDISAQYNFNARYAIELLYKAGLTADNRGEKIVTPEHLRLARNETSPFSLNELIGLHLHEKILLYSIAELFSSGKKTFVTMGEVENRYRKNTLYFQLKPLGHTRLWKMLDVLSIFGLISKHKSSKGYRGKTTLVELSSSSIYFLLKQLPEMIKNEKRKIQL